MKKRSNFIVTCLLCITWLCGCANIPLTHYYTFRPDIEKKAKTISPKYTYIVAIDTFDEEDDDEIVLLDDVEDEILIDDVEEKAVISDEDDDEVKIDDFDDDEFLIVEEDK